MRTKIPIYSLLFRGMRSWSEQMNGPGGANYLDATFKFSGAQFLNLLAINWLLDAAVARDLLPTRGWFICVAIALLLANGMYARRHLMQTPADEPGEPILGFKNPSSAAKAYFGLSVAVFVLAMIPLWGSAR